VPLITKMTSRVYMQQVRKNRGIYCDVKTLKCTSDPIRGYISCQLLINNFKTILKQLRKNK